VGRRFIRRARIVKCVESAKKSLAKTRKAPASCWKQVCSDGGTGEAESSHGCFDSDQVPRFCVLCLSPVFPPNIRNCGVDSRTTPRRPAGIGGDLFWHMLGKEH